MTLVKKMLEKMTKAEVKERFQKTIDELTKGYNELKEMLTHADEYIEYSQRDDHGMFIPDPWGYMTYEIACQASGKEVVDCVKYDLKKTEDAIEKWTKRLNAVDEL